MCRSSAYRSGPLLLGLIFGTGCLSPDDPFTTGPAHASVTEVVQNLELTEEEAFVLPGKQLTCLKEREDAAFDEYGGRFPRFGRKGSRFQILIELRRIDHSTFSTKIDQ